MSYAFLFEMAWKSALISGVALGLVMLLRSRSAADRGAVLRIGVAMLLILPLVALLFPALVVETPAPALEAGALEPAMLAAAQSAAAAPLQAGDAAYATGDWNDPGILFLLLYLGGLAMVGGRLAAGLATLRRWTAQAREVGDPRWQGALARAAGDGTPPVRLLVSDESESPLSWGWRRPVILLDLDALAKPDDAEAILAHEMAHIARRDWLSLMASRVAVALFWFNPLVWWLDREIAQQAEEAADSHAAARVEPAHYAQTLLDWARQAGRVAVPANAMAGTEPGLARRVKAILDGRAGRRSGSFWTFAAMAACAAVAAPVAALEFMPKAPEAPEAPEPAPPAAAAAVSPVPAPPAAAARAMPPAPPAAEPVPATPAPRAVPAPAAPPRLALAMHPHPPRPPHGEEWVDGERIAAEVERAVERAHRAAETATARAAEHSARAAEAVRTAHARSAVGMERGAEGMERGARGMEEEARRLRDRDYREKKIAEAARRGKRVTHEDLIEAADGLMEGAEGMREGARDMREAAEDMRRGRDDDG
jgi:beta-lactamase regulating signal transducer with metallopeptidase domain